MIERKTKKAEKPASESTYLLIFHKEDNDGLFSMAVIRAYLKRELNVPDENVFLFGADYEDMNDFSARTAGGDEEDAGMEGEELPAPRWAFYRNSSGEILCDMFRDESRPEAASKLDAALDFFDFVILTDISFNDFSAMKKIWKAKKRFYWFDHHKPVMAEAAMNGMVDVPGIRDSSRSAVLNAYEYFYDPLGTELTESRDGKKNYKIALFRELSAWDSFSFKSEKIRQRDARDLNSGATIRFALDPFKISKFVENWLYKLDDADRSDELASLSKSGEAWNKADDRRTAKIVTDYGEQWTVAGSRTALALFLQGQTSSATFMSARGKAKNGIVFKHLKDGRWGMSLYNVDRESDAEFDCGKYLKENYGGGGHPGAAGCQLSEGRFIELLKKKSV